ncbi:MAG TPA: CopD family protein [Nitrososphaera sp.]|nr:CopD family protein [Nitrososphaera sp.]
MTNLRQFPIILAVVFASAAIVLAFAILLPSAGHAYAHSLPARYSIAPNSQFADRSELPKQLAISFSERPDPKVSYIRVADAQGQRIDDNDFAVTGDNGRQAAVTLDADKVKNGMIYTVSWFTMSLDDGHIAEGAYVFGVGSEVPPSTAAAARMGGTTQYVTSYGDAIAKWPLLVAQTAIVGGAMAHVILQRKNELIGREGGRSRRPARRFSIILLASAVAMAASATAIMLLQASDLAASAGVPLAQAAQLLVTSSPAGTVWLIRLVTSAIVAVAIIVADVYVKKPHKHPLLLYAVLAAGGVSLFSNSMLSHNSAAPFLPMLATALDWVHFAAVSAWVGGLFYLSAVLAPAMRQSPRQLATTLPSFSLLATISLGVIGVTGIYMAWVHLHALDSLFTTTYGTNLVIKLTAALPMVLLGAYHQLKLHREIVVLAAEKKSGGSEEYAATARFGRTVKVEALIGIGVLFAASLLTITSPPAQEGNMLPLQQLQQQSRPQYMQHVNIDGVDVMLDISPFQPGINTFTATLTEGGKPAQNIANVVLRLTNMNANTGPIIVTLQKKAVNSNDNNDGLYSATGGYMSQAGEWEVDFIAQRTGAYDLNHTFTANLGSGSSTMQQQQRQQPPGMTTMSNMSMPEMQDHDGLGGSAPTFDSFAVLALVLSAAVAGGSAFYARQSRLQMKRTLAALG